MGAAAIIDVDGTLVDTNYHHALAWWRALRQQALTVPLWRIHRSIGMGGEKLLPALIGDELDREHGEEVRAAEAILFRELMPEVVPFEGARRLIDELRAREIPVVLASSAKAFEIEHYVDLLGVREVVDAWTDSTDVEATKPDPELVSTALEKVGADRGVMVGDSVYDCHAAARAGMESVGLLSGGFSEDELREAGATLVLGSIEELLERMDETPLASLRSG